MGEEAARAVRDVVLYVFLLWVRVRVVTIEGVPAVVIGVLSCGVSAVVIGGWR
jgi:hypothetical protein